jgi:hypothetical protein
MQSGHNFFHGSASLQSQFALRKMGRKLYTTITMIRLANIVIPTSCMGLNSLEADEASVLMTVSPVSCYSVGINVLTILNRFGSPSRRCMEMSRQQTYTRLSCCSKTSHRRRYFLHGSPASSVLLFYCLQIPIW